MLVLVGLSFKTSAVPFHFWAPDVYEGAPTPVAGFLIHGIQGSRFAVLMRFLLVVVPPSAFADASSSAAKAGPTVTAILALIATVTMIVGNVLAMTQKNIKRLLRLLIDRPGRVYVDWRDRGHSPGADRRDLLSGGLPGHQPGGFRRGGDCGADCMFGRNLGLCRVQPGAHRDWPWCCWWLFFRWAGFLDSEVLSERSWFLPPRSMRACIGWLWWGSSTR